ncbi:MAG: ABC transporter ATP-binding protein, partial [Clostridia bacterium]|nr:ABC transporter ATP-binding protein [Clostridia bacterium]
MNVLELKQISKIYSKNNGDRIKAADDINLVVKKGEAIGIVGESGSGKSTLAKLIAGMIEPTSGQILFNGEVISQYSRKALKSYYAKMQMVFQNPLDTFSPKMKISSYLIQPMLNHGYMTKSEAFKHLSQWMMRVGLDGSYLDKYPSELSGGQLQRVVIARALSLNPQLVIFDECTSALDASIQKKIIDLIVNIEHEAAFTSVFITHDLTLACDICDRIYIMNEG